MAVLGEGQPCMLGRVLDSSSRGMALEVPAPLPAGSAVKIEVGDTLVLGEVSYCTSTSEGYRAGLVIKHRLAGLAELHRLNRALHNSALTQDTRSLIMKG